MRLLFEVFWEKIVCCLPVGLGLAGEDTRFFTCCEYGMYNEVFCYRP